MTAKAIKAKDRVRRISGTGSRGTVKEVRSEVTATSADAKERGLIVSVVWDNGTFSYFAPEGLEVIEGK